MDDSQSSDCFPESATSSNHVHMDTISYEALVASTKQALSSDIRRDSHEFTFSSHFTTLLEDCNTCINQGLDLVIGLISDTEVYNAKLLAEYLEDAVCLLQMLSSFIKTVIESVSMAWHSMKTFPTTTGLIIVNVFRHCKDSEALYGNNLGTVEKTLKDLFKNCHELQLTYLMILEKHFIFDLNAMEDKDILLEALDINLKIGEVVQSLDVKTMAEQWKAYTMICEKYSVILSETNIFQHCTQVLCTMIKNNMKTALEKNQEEKVVLRSLKVASFTIKILLKMCNIFGNTTMKNYTHVLDLLFYIHATRGLEVTAECQFANLIVSPSESLLKELLSDEVFGNSLFSLNVKDLKIEDTLVGFLLTITCVMKCLLQGYTSKTVTKSKLINYVYSILPYCYIWNLDLALRSESNQPDTNSLYEHLLIHAAALAFTLNSEEYTQLEKNMVEAILSTDCDTAIFSANLWMQMARHASPQLLFNQIVWLCTMYKKLENHKMFQRSPQKVHLSYTISKLFEVMENDDKMKICKQFRIHDDDNVFLWIALRVNNLPGEVQSAAEDVVAEKLKSQLQYCNSAKGPEAIDKLIKMINLAATCTFNTTRGIEDCIVKAWSKACQRHQFVIQHIDGGTVWFYDYLQALVSLTDATWHRLCLKSSNLTKIHGVISSLIQHCTTEFRLTLIGTLCRIYAAACEICDSNLDVVFTETFTRLLQDPEDIVRRKLLFSLREYRCDKNLNRILSNSEENSLQESCSNIAAQDCKENLIAMDLKYTHKCFESRNIIQLSGPSTVSELKKVSSSNFDFADIENLFGNDNNSDLEPVSKKIKLDANEIDGIVQRLETDASLLCKVKDNVFLAEYKNRIQNVCDKLRNIIH